MRLNRYILLLCLSILFMGLAGGDMYAQKVGSPENTVNAIDYRFQKFDRTPVMFADSVKFRNKIYNIFSVGMEADWESSIALSQPMTGFNARVSLGYRITPVHAVEADALYANTLGRPAVGANLNWAVNLNNLATRRDGRNGFEVLFVAGASYRHADKDSYGANTGFRLQWNPAVNAGLNAGLFIEPKVNIMSDPYSSKTFTTIPTVSFGLTLRYNQPKYYLWDYLTPLAIKTNLLYDAATAVNFGLEAPIGNRWSVAFDWVSPWWSDYYSQKYFQIMHGTLEGRIWFGNRENKHLLTGWFGGIMVGAGVYDLMFRPDNGLQGEFASCGLVGGYAHSINKSGSLRMEYELGLGWLATEYVKYWWDGYDYALIAPSPQSWRTDWYGPIKAQVSLVYLLKIRSKVSGRE